MVSGGIPKSQGRKDAVCDPFSTCCDDHPGPRGPWLVHGEPSSKIGRLEEWLSVLELRRGDWAKGISESGMNLGDSRERQRGIAVGRQPSWGTRARCLLFLPEGARALPPPQGPPPPPPPPRLYHSETSFLISSSLIHSPIHPSTDSLSQIYRGSSGPSTVQMLGSQACP